MCPMGFEQSKDMHVVVVGSGVIGAALALRLSREGRSVEVLEAGSAAAQGASFANAGLVSPGHCFSWGEPGVPSLVARSLLGFSDELRCSPPALRRCFAGEYFSPANAVGTLGYAILRPPCRYLPTPEIFFERRAT